PAIRKMREAVEAAKASREAGRWLAVGSADIAFHSAIVELADSPRLSAFHSHVSLELRLVFGLLKDPEYLHAPFVDQNEKLIEQVEVGNFKEAAKMLEAYLLQ